MRYYINDITIGRSAKILNNLSDVIKTLEEVCVKKHRMTRRDYMQNLVELGHPADELTGKNFIDAMAESVDIGMIKDGRMVRCNIFDATHYSKYKTEMGD